MKPQNTDLLMTPDEMYDTLQNDLASPGWLAVVRETGTGSDACKAALETIYIGSASKWKRIKKFSPSGREKSDIRVFAHPTHGVKTVVEWDEPELHIFEGDRLDTDAIKNAIAELKVVEHCGDYGSLHFNPISKCGLICLDDGGYEFENDRLALRYAVTDEWEPNPMTGFFFVGNIGTVV